MKLPERLSDDSRYKLWRSRFIESGCRIKNERILHQLFRSTNQKCYSALIDVSFDTPEGHTLDRCMLLRGPCVVVVPLLVVEDDFFVAMVRQRRIVDGHYSIEFPAGGIEGEADPASAAAREVMEELGLEVSRQELVPLVDEPLHACESIFDEIVYWYCFKRFVSQGELDLLRGRFSGCREQQEFIEVDVVPIRELLKTKNFQSRVGLSLLVEKGIVSANTVYA